MWQLQSQRSIGEGLVLIENQLVFPVMQLEQMDQFMKRKCDVGDNPVLLAASEFMMRK